MKNEIRVVFLFAILFVSSFYSFNIIAIRTNGKTIYVGGTGDGNYSTIEDAIKIADNFDTIFVYKGIYYEHSLTIDKEISLIGENSSSTIIFGNITKYIIKIHENNVNILGLTFINGRSGINFFNSSFCNIKNCIFKNCSTGIYLYLSHNILIFLNVFFNNNDGVYIEESYRNTIRYNEFFKNKKGIFCSYGPDNKIEENNFISNEENSKFTKFFNIDFLKPNRWIKNYWDDWNGFGVKIIPGIMYIPTKELIGIFLPWIEIDYNPAKYPN